MRQQQLFAIAACLCSATIVLISAVPVPADNQELDVLQIPLSDDKELDVLTLGAKDQEQLIAERNKRTIGLLRDLFPDITKTIDEEINRFVNRLLQAIGPIVLGTALNPNLITGRHTNSTNTLDVTRSNEDDAVSKENTNNEDFASNNDGRELSEENLNASGVDGSALRDEDDEDDIPDTIFVPDFEFGRKKKREEIEGENFKEKDNDEEKI